MKTSYEIMEEAENNKYPFGTIFFTHQKVALNDINNSSLVKCMVTTKSDTYYNAICEEDVEGMDANWNIHKGKNTIITEQELDEKLSSDKYRLTQEDIKWIDNTKIEYLKAWRRLDDIFNTVAN